MPEMKKKNEELLEKGIKKVIFWVPNTMYYTFLI